MEKKRELQTFTTPAQDAARERYERINRKLFLSKAATPMDERIIAKAIEANYDRFTKEYERYGAKGKEHLFDKG